MLCHWPAKKKPRDVRRCDRVGRAVAAAAAVCGLCGQFSAGGLRLEVSDFGALGVNLWSYVLCKIS